MENNEEVIINDAYDKVKYEALSAKILGLITEEEYQSILVDKRAFTNFAEIMLFGDDVIFRPKYVTEETVRIYREVNEYFDEHYVQYMRGILRKPNLMTRYDEMLLNKLPEAYDEDGNVRFERKFLFDD